MEKRKKLSLSLLVAALLLSGCVNNGTEIGNPGSKRGIAGLLSASAPSALSVYVGNSALAASCPDGNGAVSVVFATAANAEVVATTSDTGGFSAQIDQQERYEVVFRQKGETCAELYYDSYGEHVVIGKGTLDIDVGEITDLGGGVFVPANDPSAYCDDDGDGIADSMDADADGDGSDDTDVDGYVNWFYEDEAAEGTP